MSIIENLCAEDYSDYTVMTFSYLDGTNRYENGRWYHLYDGTWLETKYRPTEGTCAVHISGKQLFAGDVVEASQLFPYLWD